MPISCSIYLIFKHLENACYKLLCRVHVNKLIINALSQTKSLCYINFV